MIVAMQVSTLDILIEKAHFEPKVARAVAEAIENETRVNQLVTVPVLDSRLGDLKASMDFRFDDIKSSVDSRFTDLETSVNSRFADVYSMFNDLKTSMNSRFASIDTRFTDLESSMDARFAGVDSRFGIMESRFDAKLEAQKSELVRWVLTAMMAQTTIVLAFTYALSRTH